MKRSKLARLALAFAAMGVASATKVMAVTAVDFTAAADQIKTDNTAALAIGLPIFATVFGIIVVKKFFKSTTH